MARATSPRDSFFPKPREVWLFEPSQRGLPAGKTHPILGSVETIRVAMNSSPEKPEENRSKWRSRVEALLLVAGGLLLLIPTLAIFLAGGD